MFTLTHKAENITGYHKIQWKDFSLQCLLFESLMQRLTENLKIWWAWNAVNTKQSSNAWFNKFPVMKPSNTNNSHISINWYWSKDIHTNWQWISSCYNATQHIRQAAHFVCTLQECTKHLAKTLKLKIKKKNSYDLCVWQHFRIMATVKHLRTMI